MRPIVSYINAPAFRISKYISKNFQNFTGFESKYSIKNSLQLIEMLKSKQIPSNAKLVSFDVKSLFPSIPLKSLLVLLQNHVNKSNFSSLNKQKFLNLIKMCLTQSYFQFNGKIYSQNEGLPMGSPTSPLFAEVYMSAFEENLFQMDLALISKVFFWVRYVDDIFCVWAGTDRQLSLFLGALNGITKNIQFTMETEADGSLNFLDLTIRRNNHSGVSFSIYRKPTATDTVIPKTSCQSWSIRMAAFHSYIHRLVNVPLSNVDYMQEVKILKVIAKNNGYNPEMIDKLIFRKTQKIIQNLIFSPSSQKASQEWVSLPYVPSISNSVSQHFKKFDFKPIIINKLNLGKILVNNKDQRCHSKKSGVYEIKCASCNIKYIGQSGRSFGTRMKEHSAAIRLKNLGCSAFSDHCVSNGHDFDGTFRILHNSSKGKLLNILEGYEIWKASKSGVVCNDKQDILRTPLLAVNFKLGNSKIFRH